MVDLARLELVGHGPAGRAGDLSQAALQLQAVDLQHHAVDLVGQRIPPAFHLLLVGDDLLRAAAHAGQRHRLESPGLQRRQEIRVAREGRGLHRAHAVTEQVEGPAGGDLRVQLLEGAGGGVAGIGEHVLSSFFPLPVEALESVRRIEHFAAHLQQRRHGNPVPAQGQGDRADGADVLRDVLAVGAVAPGRADLELAVLVHQLHPDAVDLGLHHVLDGIFGLQEPLNPLLEVRQLVGVGDVVQRQHGQGVPHGGELLHRRTAHLGGGRVGQRQLRMFLLQPAEAPEQLVVFGICDGRAVEDVVAMAVLLHLRAQLPNLRPQRLQ